MDQLSQSPGDKPSIRAVRGTQLPKGSLKQAEELAKQLWTLAKKSSVPRESFAHHLKASPTSSSFDTKVGLMRYFGLITSGGKAIQLTELGQEIVQTYDPERQQKARRESLMSEVNFAKLLADYDGHELPSEDVLTNRLHYQHSLGEESARQAARALIESAEYAGIVDSSGKVQLTPTEHLAADNVVLDDEPAETPLDQLPHEDSVKSRVMLGGFQDEKGRVTVNVTVNLNVEKDGLPELERILHMLGFSSPDVT